MKNTIIGGFVSLAGSLGILSVAIVASSNMAGSWSTPPGRFWTTVSQINMTPFAIFSFVLLALGLAILGREYSPNLLSRMAAYFREAVPYGEKGKEE